MSGAAILTANRRFTFAASRRLARDGWPAHRNEQVYGAGRERQWGTGENYQAYFVFSGDVDGATGMLVNLAEVKAAISPVVDGRYDHRFLNRDTPPFDSVPPTPENVARQLLMEATAACRALPPRLVACHVAESRDTGATAYADGRVEREFWLDFSAARRTYSPHLSDAENREVFGVAASPAGHGHGYRLRVVLAGEPDETTGLVAGHGVVAEALGKVHRLLDHRHLNLEVAELAGQPMTTECLARFIYRYLHRDLPVARVRLYEMPHFFAEYDGGRFALGLERSFSAAHRLHNPAWDEATNRRVYGKCSNANGHGHRYLVQATVAGELDERVGIVHSLRDLDSALAETLADWDHRHLDLEVPAFSGRPSTGENIVALLWPGLDQRLAGKLVRLRVQETENNRFALRRAGVEGNPCAP